MIKEAIEKIESMAAIATTVVDGRIYSSKPIFPVTDPLPKVLKIDTLTGFVDYLKTNIDGLTENKLLVHIKDFQIVDLLSNFDDKWKERDHYIRAERTTLKFSFGHFIDVESFIIQLQSLFIQDENTAAILKIVGNVSDSIIKQFSDDGVTQQANVKVGVSRVENVTIPNPITLAPFRTFMEIQQPSSKFIFRMKSGGIGQAPTCALFEGDGGMWKNDAIIKIKEWLTDKVGTVAIIA